MCNNLTVTESQILIMIYEGKSIKELLQWIKVSLDVFDDIIRDIMDKTGSTTWEELSIIGAQLASVSKPSPYFSLDRCFLIDERFTKEEDTSIEYLANKWQHIPENER